MNGLEQKYSGELTVLRVNIFSEAGEALTLRYGSRVTPTFIFLNGMGEEIWRQVGGVDADRVHDALAGK